MQRIKASKHYCDKLYKMFYKGYPEMPFISQDRELNTNWIKQSQMFGVTPTKEMMTRYSDGLLPGHVYMLYWIREIHRIWKIINVVNVSQVTLETSITASIDILLTILISASPASIFCFNNFI